MGSFKEEYLSLMELSYDKMNKYDGLTGLKISTMTMVCDMKIDIDLEKLTKNFVRPNYPLCFIKKAKTTKDVTYTKRGKPKKSFYNQTTITINQNTKKSIKVFKNGKLQMTGIRSMNDFKSTIEVIKGILKNSSGAVEKEHEEKFKEISPVVAMINSNFNLNKELDLRKIKSSIVLDKEITDVSYNPDVYPGVNAKYNGTSILIFGTGNVVITGAKSIKAISEAYVFITSIVCENKLFHIRNGIGKKPAKSQINYINGYPEDLYLACK